MNLTSHSLSASWRRGVNHRSDDYWESTKLRVYRFEILYKLKALSQVHFGPVPVGGFRGLVVKEIDLTRPLQRRGANHPADDYWGGSTQ
ncbi:hypothetical protein SAMN05444280_11224 [Tangfeifania diversioriginum]|uniref:Uncharacterized protein n=1 Tax=Tangfeifania diversioriginum TaxID=1168035 RepID=A0A1M6GZN4_9BACT|nr:hypothetical protein SAMN05444280_11224 [Tangfeifania diversioriginum]